MMTCPNCSGPAAPRFTAQDWNRRISDEVFCYHRCDHCGLIFIASVPQDLDRYYPASYYPVPANEEEVAARAASERYKIEIVQQHIRSGRLLEIGGSFGAFASLAKNAGFDVDVIEMDARCCEFLRDVVKVRAFNETDPAAGLERLGDYDVIALWQVIEHLPDPWSLLKTAAAHLVRGGFLFIAAPNPESFQFRMQGARWPHLDAPRHLSLIPIDVLTAKLAELGIRRCAARTDDPGSLHWNRFGWEMWAANWVQRNGAKRLLFPLGRAIGRAASAIEQQPLRGSTYTLVFQKPSQSQASA